MTLTAIEQAARALAQLSDAEWAQVKRDEDRRRAQQHTIRDLSKRYRELRDRGASAMTGPTITTRCVACGLDCITAGATGNAR